MTERPNAERLEIKMHRPVVIHHDSGLLANHDMACPVCSQAPAVYHMQNGVFSPCWGCQQSGWELRLKRSFWQRIKDLVTW